MFSSFRLDLYVNLLITGIFTEEFNLRILRGAQNGFARYTSSFFLNEFNFFLPLLHLHCECEGTTHILAIRLDCDDAIIHFYQVLAYH